MNYSNSLKNTAGAVGTFPRGFASNTSFAWSLVRADHLVTLNYGKALVEKNQTPGKVPVYGTNGQCGWHNKSLVQGPGVILGRKGMGPLGVEWCETDFWVIDTAYYVTANTPELDLKLKGASLLSMPWRMIWRLPSLANWRRVSMFLAMAS